MKPSCNINSSIENWLILSDYYEEMQYDNVVQFIRTTMIKWSKWLKETRYQPYWFSDNTDGHYCWINEVIKPYYSTYCSLPKELYYKICPLSREDYAPQVIYSSKEEAYLDLFLAYLENK